MTKRLLALVAPIAAATSFALADEVVYNCALNAAASTLTQATDVNAPFAGTLKGNYDVTTNPTGTQTIPGFFGGSGNNQIPYTASFVLAGDIVSHPTGALVVGTDIARLYEHLRHHLDIHGFADVQVRTGAVMQATRLDPDDPWVRFTLASLERTTGKPTVLLPNLGGSLPNDVFADILSLPTVWIPHSYPACSQHAPDEHLLAPVVREALEAMTGLFWDLGEAAPDLPRKARHDRSLPPS
jgi:hypothetical protein